MNYIEAHNICSNYIDIFANNLGIYRPISLLRKCGASSKKMVEDAMILFLAHAVLWNELSEQELEATQVLLLHLDNFVDDEFARQYSENFQVVQKANKSALYKIFHKRTVDASMQYITQNTKMRLHDCSRVEDSLSHMADYKQNIYTPKMKALLQEEATISNDEYWRRFLLLIADFSDEVCNFSGISTEPSDYYFFVSFELMHDWIDDENVGKYYSKYREYILSHFDRWA